MEDVNAIHRIFKNLKYEMDNNGWVYQWHLGGVSQSLCKPSN